MPVITVLSLGSDEDSKSHPAAAVMGAMLAMLSEPIVASPLKGKKKKVEKTIPRNPRNLTLKQHVFPKRSIERFTNTNGRVAVLGTMRSGTTRNAKPSDSIFCADRAWDQRAEAGYMKHIEDDFQLIASSIVSGQLGSISIGQKPIIDAMYALWYMRARYREIRTQEVKLKGIPGYVLTKEQEEILEKKGVLFVREGGLVPSRQLNGLELQGRVDSYVSELATLDGWGVISAQCGEFVVPDVPTYLFLPLSPQILLAAGSPDGIILEKNVAEINRAVLATRQTYCFAREFSCCPS